jgi:hypothetical protein
MRRPTIGRPSASLVVASLALFVALGGTGYAAVTITGRQVENGSIKSADIGAGQVKSANLGRGSVTSLKVKDRSLLSRDFKAGQLPTGATGPQGPKGDPGPSNAYYAHGVAPYVLGLPAGDYVVYGQLVGERTGPSAGSVFGLTAYGVGAGESGQTPSSMATFPPDTTATVPFQAVIHLPQGGAIGSNYTSNAVSTEVDITVIRVGSATP